MNNWFRWWSKPEQKLNSVSVFLLLDGHKHKTFLKKKLDSLSKEKSKDKGNGTFDISQLQDYNLFGFGIIRS